MLCLLRLLSVRANRAQFTEISFQSVSDDDIANVALPSTQGVAEDEGKNIFKPIFSV